MAETKKRCPPLGPRPAWARGLTLAAVGIATSLLAVGCSRQPSDGAAQPGRQAAGPPRRAVPVAVAVADTGDIASYYRATATLEAEREAEVLSRVSGVVEELRAEEGDILPVDAPLLRIANDEYRYRLQQAEATTANLRSRYERLAAMVDEQLVTEEEYETARSDLASAEAEEGLARLNLSYTTVRAPFAGGVVRRLVDVGHNLNVGTPLFVMADFDPLLARVHVPAREFRKLRRDQVVDLVLDSDESRLSGKIQLISPVIDPESGTIKVTVEVAEYPPGTRPGDFAEVRIVTELRRGATLVPRAAVVTEKGETVVYAVASADEQGAGADRGPAGAPQTVAERRLVTVGFRDDESAQILTGVAPGERIVVKGQSALEHGSPITILDEATATTAADASPPANAPRDSTRQRGGGREPAGR